MNDEVKKLAERKVFPTNKQLTETEITIRVRVLEQQKRELLQTIRRNYNERIRILMEQKQQLLNSYGPNGKSEQKGEPGPHRKTDNTGESSN